MQDVTLRENILSPHYREQEIGGARYFAGLSLNELEKLIKLGFVERGPWNSCDGVDDMFIPFMRRHPGFTAHGYAIAPQRKDCRITVEGVEKEGASTLTELADFAITFKNADEMNIDPDQDCSYLRCWYD